MDKFYAFCDKWKIGFTIHFRENFSDPNARFYLTFNSLLDLHYFDKFDPYEQFERFQFKNGRTPNEAIQNTVKFLKGKVIRLVKFDEGYSDKSVHVFAEFS